MKFPLNTERSYYFNEKLDKVNSANVGEVSNIDLVWGESHCTLVALYVAKGTTRAEGPSPGIEPRAFWLWRQSVKLSATTVSDYMTERVEIRRTLDAMVPSSHRHRFCNLHHNIESSLRGMLIVYP